MAFPNTVVEEAWRRSGGNDECRRTYHNHPRCCCKPLVFRKRGSEEKDGWETHHKTADGPYTLSDGKSFVKNATKEPEPTACNLRNWQLNIRPLVVSSV